MSYSCVPPFAAATAIWRAWVISDDTLLSEESDADINEFADVDIAQVLLDVSREWTGEPLPESRAAIGIVRRLD